MSGSYSKAVVEIKICTIGANIQDFVSTIQVENRLSHLDIQKTNSCCALELIENEESVLKTLLEKR